MPAIARQLSETVTKHSHPQCSRNRLTNQHKATAITPSEGLSQVGNILILDDDQNLLKSWKKGLENHGHSVTSALTSSEAIAYFETRTFDLVIADLMISIDGNESLDSGRRLLKFINTQHGTLPTAVLGVTGFKPLGLEGAGRSTFATYGVKEILFKPFELKELIRKAESLLPTG